MQRLAKRQKNQYPLPFSCKMRGRRSGTLLLSGVSVPTQRTLNLRLPYVQYEASFFWFLFSVMCNNYAYNGGLRWHRLNQY
ncbi:Uncharacterized protein APZ42_013245 [Daphnia magna]|uniref:Uncharacterized protein n=1 Tax=Daphnia magna TaxID=35525 RepID=A0A162R4U3_9CRUS|nr:Uncharacterized protein APZ42_013245 [Daphnia magna]